MKRIPSVLAVMAVGLVLQPLAIAQFNNVGTSAANFLKIPVGARGAALGGAYAAIVNDATSLYWNPAGMAAMDGHEVSFNQNYWLLDLRQDFVAGVFSINNNSRIGISVSYLSMGEMKQTTPAQPRGTGLEFTAYDVALGLAYAQRVTDRIMAGAQAKFIRQTISQSSASGLGFDVGLQYHGEWNDLRIGATITNFGSSLAMSGDDLRRNLDPDPATGSNPTDVPLLLETEAFQLPMQFQFGIAITPLRSSSLSFTPILDIRKPRDLNQELRLGGEIAFLDAFFIRGGLNAFAINGDFFGKDDVVVQGKDGVDNPIVGGGYTNPTTITREDFRDGSTLFNVGTGIKYTMPSSGLGMKFDYAFSRIQTLDDAHRFGLSVMF